MRSALHAPALCLKHCPTCAVTPGQNVVIKYGGNAMAASDPALDMEQMFARDVALLRQVGINPIIVHGGGPQISKMLDKVQIKSEFIDGLRVTTKDAIDVVEMVVGQINKDLSVAITRAGSQAVGVSGKDANLVIAEKLTRIGSDGTVKDWGFVGEIKQINPDILNIMARENIVPVIAPIAIGEDGETYNVNADTVAGAIAAAVDAARLILLTDVPGVLDHDKKLILELSPDEVATLMNDGVIQGGMIPKVETCLMAINGGVDGAVIVDGRVPHALLLEMFTEDGAGTLIKHNAQAN